MSRLLPKSSGWSKMKKQLVLSVSSSRLAMPLIVASIVGSLTGFLIVGFVKAIDFSEALFFGEIAQTLNKTSPLLIFLVPTIGGLLVGLITTSLSPDARGHGVPEVLKAIVLKGGKIPAMVVLAKFVSSAIAIGSGSSVGREGPAVQLGAGVGSSLGRIFHLNESRVKNFVACGAAAGISAVFNAPITGVMFALEVILRDFGAKALSTVVVASVAASIISRIFLGESPAFTIPRYLLWSPFEIFIYLFLGVLAALVAITFIFSLDRFEIIFEKAKRVPLWLRPAIGGLAVGVTGIYFPQVFGMGFHVIEQTMHGGLTVKVMFILIFLKIFATSISLGSGSSGGSFAPTLFVGAMTGGLLGKIVYGHMPFDVAPPGAYALVGMASVFAACFHSPVTAILLVFEMTGDYQMILPIMVASVVAASISQLVSRDSIDTIKFRREGINIQSLEGISFLGAIQVRDAMSTLFHTVPQELSAKELMEVMSKEKEKVFYVVNKKNELVGGIRRNAIQELLMEKDLSMLIAEDIASPIHEVVFPDEPLSDAAHYMQRHNLGNIPVVNPTEPGHIIGNLQFQDVFRAYTELAQKRDELVSRFEQESHQSDETVQIRFTIRSNSTVNGKQLKELKIPDGVVLTSLNRKHKTIIPEGDTVLKGKDKIWAVVLPESEAVFREWLKKNKLN